MAMVGSTETLRIHLHVKNGIAFTLRSVMVTGPLQHIHRGDLSQLGQDYTISSMQPDYMKAKCKKIRGRTPGDSIRSDLVVFTPKKNYIFIQI